MASDFPLRTRFQRDIGELESYFENFARRHRHLTCCMLRYQPEIGPGLDAPLSRYLSLPVVPTQLGFDPRLQLVHADDATGALLAATIEPVRGAVNVAPSGSISLTRALRLIDRPQMPIPHPVFGPAMARLGERLGAGSLYGDAVRLLRYGRGVDNTRLRTELGYEPRYDAVATIRDFAAADRGMRLLPQARHRRRARSPRGVAAMSAAAPTSASIPEIGVALPARHERRHRRRPRSARGRRSGRLGDLPKALRDGIERMARRLRGDYHEDEWGFDEEFAEAAYPFFELLYDALVAGRGDRRRQRSRARPGDARLQPRRGDLPVRRVDDHRRDHEGAPAAALAPLHGPRLGLLAAVPLRLHAQGRRRSREPLQRDPDPRGATG